MKIVVESKKLNRSIAVDSESLITFQDGIPGFPRLKRYLLIDDEQGQLFLWLQAEEDPDLGFVVIDPLIFAPDYNPEFPEADLEAMQIKDQESMAILSLVSIPEEDPMKLTANLMAPLVINHRLRIGKQIVLHESGYNVREPIIKAPSQNQEMVSNR